MSSAETRFDKTTTARDLPCCGREVRLTFSIRDGIEVHERTCPECGLQWTFATVVTVTPHELLKKGETFGYGFTVALMEGRPTAPVRAETLDRAHGWFDANPEEFRKKALEIGERRRAR